MLVNWASLFENRVTRPKPNWQFSLLQCFCTDKDDDGSSAIAKESALKMRRKRQNIVEADSVDDRESETAKSAKKSLLHEVPAEVEDENADGDADVDHDMQKMLAAFGGGIGLFWCCLVRKLIGKEANFVGGG